MGDVLQVLFEAVRDACPAARWSRGIELSRAGLVRGEQAEADEVVFLVGSRGTMIPITVRLFPDDAEWECQCSTGDDACEHVAAAVIAWRRTQEQGGELPEPPQRGTIGYRFERSGGALALQRVIVHHTGIHPLRSTLAAIADGKVDGPQFVASQADLAAELVLGTHRKGRIERSLVMSLFRKLGACSDIRLDDCPIEVSAEGILPVARLEDQDEGFRLSLVDNPAISESFENGIVRCGDVLQPVGESRLSGRELHELPRGLHFTASEVGELIGSVLPALRARIPVEICTERLPDTADEPPRIRFVMERNGEELSVLPTLEYGTPALARIDAGRLVHLQGSIPVRDEHAERALAGDLRRQLGLVPGVRADFEGEEAVGFVSRLGSWKASIEGVEHQFFSMAPPLVPRLEIGESSFDLDFESIAGDAGGRAGHAGHADPERVLRAWREGASLVPLLSGGWAPLPGDWLQRYGHQIADLLAAREAGDNVPRCLIPDLARLCDDLDIEQPPAFAELRNVLEDFDSIPQSELPMDLSATLRPYQKQGVDWLCFMARAGLGAMLADDMGLGKTLQALCSIRSRTLVVAPTSVIHNWKEEITRHRPGLSFAVYHGPGRSLDAEVDVILTTYAILRIETERLATIDWGTVILDEAQAIKNPNSQVARAAFRLRAGFKMTLTGTPVENRLEDLWSQFNFINPGLLGGRRGFNENYANPINVGQEGAAERLRKRIGPFVLRRLKKDVATDLPPRTEIVLRCELSQPERELYDSIRAATLSNVVAKLKAGGSVLPALEALLRLRQAACHPGLIPGRTADSSAKLRLLIETLDSVVAEGHRALVFSQWTGMLDLIQPQLRAAELPFVRLDGSTRDRGSVIQTFQDSSGPPVMLVSLKAGGTGLNLTAADHVFLLDLWWNPAVEDQAADRAHRIGQQRPVMIYRIVAQETVEERILLLQQSKRDLANAALGDADQAASITRDQLLELLS
jgi:hypothetical protein